MPKTKNRASHTRLSDPSGASVIHSDDVPVSTGGDHRLAVRAQKIFDGFVLVGKFHISSRLTRLSLVNRYSPGVQVETKL